MTTTTDAATAEMKRPLEANDDDVEEAPEDTGRREIGENDVAKKEAHVHGGAKYDGSIRKAPATACARTDPATPRPMPSIVSLGIWGDRRPKTEASSVTHTAAPSSKTDAAPETSGTHPAPPQPSLVEVRDPWARGSRIRAAAERRAI